jgi:hypothetical protein
MNTAKAKGLVYAIPKTSLVDFLSDFSSVFPSFSQSFNDSQNSLLVLIRNQVVVLVSA